MPRSKSRSRSRSRSPKKDEYSELSLEELKKRLVIAEKEKLLHSEYIDRAVVKDITKYGEHNIILSEMIQKVFTMIEEYVSKQEKKSTELDLLDEFTTDIGNIVLSRTDKRMIESKIKDYKGYSDHNQELSEKVDKITQRIRNEESFLRALEKQRKASAEKREKK